MQTSTSAKMKVIMVLGLPELRTIGFSFLGHTLPHGSFSDVHWALISDRIDVHVGGHSNTSLAYYNSENNRFEFAREPQMTEPAMARIVHEATHASFDLRRTNEITVGAEECMAYIAQQIFSGFRGHLINGTPAEAGGDPQMAKVFVMARSLATAAVQGKQLDPRRCQMMMATLATTKQYRGSHAHTSLNDGV